MALRPNFPTSPYAPLIPEQRWFPADEALRSRGTSWLVETKGREEIDLPQKMARLKQWCAGTTAAENADGGTPGQRYDFVFVDQTGFEKHAPKTFAVLVASFTDHKG